jgi:hypothetical protein
VSILKNLVNAFMPHLEARRSTATLAAVNAELVHDVNGDESAVIFINGTGTLNATYSVQGSPDGVNYADLVCYPYAPASVGGTLPQPGQPLASEAVNVATVQRMLCAAVGGLQKIRVRLTAYATGSAAIFINSDACASISPFVRDQKSATLMVSATGAASAAVTATLPAVTGLRHYIDRIWVNRSATALLTAAAAPTIVTTTNLPGTPALTFGNDAAAQGVDREQVMEFGGAGLAALLASTATTVVCPVYTGVIWRVNVAYRLGL